MSHRYPRRLRLTRWAVLSWLLPALLLGSFFFPSTSLRVAVAQAAEDTPGPTPAVTATPVPVTTSSTSNASSTLVQDAEFIGVLHAIKGGDAPQLFLTDQNEQTYHLTLSVSALEAAGGLTLLDQQIVRITGVLEGTYPKGGTTPNIKTSNIALDKSGAVKIPGIQTSGPERNAVTGSRPFINILCKFSDYTATPRDSSYFTSLMSNTYPGMDYYFRETSLNTINLAGTGVVGWYTLPNPRSYYVYGSPLKLDFTRATNDCTAVADASVNFSGYQGINLMFNADLDSYAWGGSSYLTLDGVSKVWPMTWMPPWGYNNQAVLAHEMGHAFGMPHSANAAGTTYGNVWDVMSDTWTICGALSLAHPTFGCLGQHQNTYHKDIPGWIPANRKFTTTGGSQSITLERVAQPGSSGYLMAVIPIASTNRYYTVEARQRISFDNNTPGNAVIIHEVNPSRTDPSWVVDTQDPANSNDAGSQWTVGETYQDSTNGISVAVNSATSSGFVITLTTPNINPPTAPTNLGFTNVTSSQINLSWTDNATTETGFSLERRITTSGTWSVLAGSLGVNTTSYQNTGLTASTQYCYRVRAFNNGGNSAYSNEACATTLPVNNPVPTITSLSPSSTTVGSSSFTLYVYGSNFVTNSVIRWNGANRTTTYNNSGLVLTGISASDVSQTGTVTVTVFNPTPGGGLSNSLTFTINPTLPNSPTNLSPLVISSSQINLSWSDNANNETGFIVERKQGVSGSWSVLVNNLATNTTSYQNSGLASNTQYCYRVKAYNTSGQSTYSNEACATTFNADNPVPQISSLSPSSISAGKGSFNLFIYGSNFISGSVIRWNGINLNTEFLNSGQLRTSVPIDYITQPKTVNLTVFNPTPGGGVSNTFAFTITPNTNPGWVYTNSMSKGRQQHSATKLASGKVLVVGGISSFETSFPLAITVTELYDPASGTWSVVNSPNKTRDCHTATTLQNGTVLVAGRDGANNSVATSEIYNPATGSWSYTGNLNQFRCNHAAVLLSDGRVMFIGGVSAPYGYGALVSTEIYNPATGSWSYTGNLNAARGGHTATVLKDGRVLVVGGTTGSTSLQTAEIYNPTTGSWSYTGSLSITRSYHTATLLQDGRVLVVGGSTTVLSTEIYNPATSSWSLAANIEKGVYGQAAILLSSGKVLITGGVSSYSNPYYYFSANTQIYDPVSNSWSPGTNYPLNEGRAYFPLVLLDSGKLLATGGMVTCGFCSNYNKGIETNELFTLPPETLPNAPTNLVATSANNQVSLGWTDNSNNEQGFVVQRKVGSGSWQDLTPSVTLNNYTDFGVSSNTTYSYRVRAYNSAGSSGYSNEVSVVITVVRPVDSIPVYRFYKPASSTHFYSAKEDEKQWLIDQWSHVYTYEGIAFYSFAQNKTGLVPVYRFYNVQTQTHLYTINEGEKQWLLDNWSHLYTYEGIVFYTYPTQASGTQPVYRFYNREKSTHFFTINQSEKEWLEANWSHIYTYEGIAFYAYQNT